MKVSNLSNEELLAEVNRRLEVFQKLGSLLGSGKTKATKRRHSMSAEARARISKAQRARWAKQRKTAKTVASKPKTQLVPAA